MDVMLIAEFTRSASMELESTATEDTAVGEDTDGAKGEMAER